MSLRSLRFQRETHAEHSMKALLLDLDDTLLDDRTAIRIALDAFLAFHGIGVGDASGEPDSHSPPLSIERSITAGRRKGRGVRATGESIDDVLNRWRAISRRHWLRFESGRVSFQEQRRDRVREFLGRSMNDAEADEAFTPFVDAYENSCRLLPGVDEFLAATLHVPKVIVTNGEREQQNRKVDLTGLREHVMGVITPSDCGYWKPHAGIFLAAVTMLDVLPADCIMIGDDRIRDIEPAVELGMGSFLVEAGHPKWDPLKVLLEV